MAIRVEEREGGKLSFEQFADIVYSTTEALVEAALELGNSPPESMAVSYALEVVLQLVATAKDPLKALEYCKEYLDSQAHRLPASKLA